MSLNNSFIQFHYRLLEILLWEENPQAYSLGLILNRPHVRMTLTPLGYICTPPTERMQEGRKCFSLTTHSTHFIYGYMVSDITVKNHWYSERGNPLLPHGLLFPISSEGSFICTIPQTGWHTPQPLVHQSWSTGWNEKWLNGSTMKDRSDDPSNHERKLLPQSYMSLPWMNECMRPTLDSHL